MFLIIFFILFFSAHLSHFTKLNCSNHVFIRKLYEIFCFLFLYKLLFLQRFYLNLLNTRLVIIIKHLFSLSSLIKLPFLFRLLLFKKIIIIDYAVDSYIEFSYRQLLC